MTQRRPPSKGDERGNAAELASAVSDIASPSRQSAGLFPFGTLMGLFSTKAKPHPVIETQGLRIVYHLDHEWWEFGLEGTDFISYGSTFACPTPAQLASILSDIVKLRPEMIQRLAKGWNGWKGVRMNDGEVYSIDLTDFHSDGGFEVSWSGGATWGDMGINFKIKDHAITDESWGD